MRCVRNFVGHSPTSGSRMFTTGEIVPEEYWGSVNVPSLVETDDGESTGGGDAGEQADSSPFPEFADLSTIPQVVGWVMDEEDEEQRLVKARFALEVETGEGGKNRSGLIDSLTELIEFAESTPL